MKFIKLNEYDVNVNAIESISGVEEEMDVQFLPTYKKIPTGRFYFTIKTFSGDKFDKIYYSSTEASNERQAFMENIK